jgi:hypothetical protein
MGTDHLKYLNADWRIILQKMLEETESALTGLSWLRIGCCGGIL